MSKPGNDAKTPSATELYHACESGSQTRPWIPKLRSDTQPALAAFREQEGEQDRSQRFRKLWQLACQPGYGIQSKPLPRQAQNIAPEGLGSEDAEKLRAKYQEELLERFGQRPGDKDTVQVNWQQFQKYVDKKEEELWVIFHELDLDGNGHLDRSELDLALRTAGIALSPVTLTEFMVFLTTTPQDHSHSITFRDFRDFLLFLPRKASTAEIYQYYRLKKYLGEDGRGVARVTMEGDVSLSAEDKPPDRPPKSADEAVHAQPEHRQTKQDEQEEADDTMIESHTALKFLLAGGIAGAVSRTCTAPFDRIKIFLITRQAELIDSALTPLLRNAEPASSTMRVTAGARVTWAAIARIYAEGGVLGFWVGNGLSVAKIFPESAIKFFSYESAKRMFAKYWHHVDDPRDISSTSRFLAGGIGGITSQLSIYPVETLKTQMMSNKGDQRKTLLSATRHLWALGGVRAYYRGLGIGLVGVFPYSAIDFSTFEALKMAYLRSFPNPNTQDPPILAVLLFGSISGSVGATTVYPLNLVRTRLQAAGSSGHPAVYTGAMDVVRKTMESEGWRGFYRGLAPTLAKVVPAVSISYVVYEHSKRTLGV